jgi:hypothetical protein
MLASFCILFKTGYVNEFHQITQELVITDWTTDLENGCDKKVLKFLVDQLKA